MGIRIVSICGSVREGNFTGQALDLVDDELRQLEVELVRINPADLELTLPGQPQSPGALELQEAVAGATGVILSTPEYHGGYSSVIKLVIDNLGFPSKLGGKPVALLGVAAGQIGAIKALENLRGVCSHVGALLLPGPVSIARVQGSFADGACTDAAVEKRVRALAHTLVDYIHGHICPRIALEAMVRPK